MTWGVGGTRPQATDMIRPNHSWEKLQPPTLANKRGQESRKWMDFMSLSRRIRTELNISLWRALRW